MLLVSKASKYVDKCPSLINYRLVNSIFRYYIQTNYNIKQIKHICTIRSTNKYTIRDANLSTAGFNKNVRFYSDVPSTQFADLQGQRIEYFFELQNTFKNQSMSPKIKSKSLKIILLKLIEVLENGEFPNKQLPFINAVINFIDQTPSPLDSFTSDEMIAILRSILGGMTLQDVRYIDFFPRFYNSLRECKEYQDDGEIRLQLFEIFINYVLLSTKRNNVSKIIEAFISEEKSLHNSDSSAHIVEILLEAFKTIKPDTETLLLLTKICPDLSSINKDLSDLPILDQILATFFRAADEEISESFEDNFVSERLVDLIDTLENKVNDPIDSYVEILYFAVKNNFNDVSKNILNKLEKSTAFFTSDKFNNIIFKPDVLFALVTASLKFNKSNDAENLINSLKKKDENDYVEDEWMALLQYESYKIDEYKPSIKLIEEFNKRLDDLKKDYAFGDVDTMNLVLESLCWSGKSFEYIQTFTKDFQEEFTVQTDAKSAATILNYLCKDKVNHINIKKASDYFLEFKDQIDWENDYERGSTLRY